MGKYQIVNGSVILPDRIMKGGSVLVEDGEIRSVGKLRPVPGAKLFDARGLYVAPGFIDTHIHGDPAAVIAYESRFGTTSILPAISCSSDKDRKRAIKAIELSIRSDELGRSVLGYRLEGPFIGKARSGAQDRRFIKRPSVSRLRRIIKESKGLLRIMTIAPELEGAIGLINMLKNNAVIASAGHTDGDFESTARGIGAGITHATHLYNGMPKLEPNKPGVACACLKCGKVWAEIIIDMVHVKKPLLKLALSTKKRLILITDSVRAEMPGCRVKGGVYRLKDGTIAGSRLTMIGAVKNTVRHCGASIDEAVRYASLNPAKLLGLDGRKGSVAKGKDADLVIFDKDFNVKMTMAHGNIIYIKRGLKVCAG